MKKERKQSFFTLSLDIKIYSMLTFLLVLICIFLIITLLSAPIYESPTWPWFSGIVISGISLLFYFHRLTALKDKIKKIKCLNCSSAKALPQIPYCEACLKKSLEQVQKLVEEAEERIKTADKLKLTNQVEGTKEWFSDNLPEPIKFILSQGLLTKIKKHFAQAEIIYPHNLEKFPINSDNSEVNIPSEGLKILEKLTPLLIIEN